MAEQNTQPSDELTRNRQAGWNGFILFSKWSIAIVIAVLILLALLTL